MARRDERFLDGETVAFEFRQWPSDGTPDGIDPSGLIDDWDGTIRLLTQDEKDGVADAIANEERQVKATAVDNAVATLRQWAVDADGTTVTNGNNTTVTQQMVDRLGVFFDRFADLVESKL